MSAGQGWAGPLGPLSDGPGRQARAPSRPRAPRPAVHLSRGAGPTGPQMFSWTRPRGRTYAAPGTPARSSPPLPPPPASTQAAPGVEAPSTRGASPDADGPHRGRLRSNPDCRPGARFGSGFYPEAFKLDSFPRSPCEDQASRELVAGPGRGGFQNPQPWGGQCRPGTLRPSGCVQQGSCWAADCSQ